MSYDNVAQNGEDISIVVKFGEPSSGLRFIVYDNQTRQVIGSSNVHMVRAAEVRLSVLFSLIRLEATAQVSEHTD